MTIFKHKQNGQLYLIYQNTGRNYGYLTAELYKNYGMFGTMQPSGYNVLYGVNLDTFSVVGER
jgi:hypothetical protein